MTRALLLALCLTLPAGCGTLVAVSEDFGGAKDALGKTKPYRIYGGVRGDADFLRGLDERERLDDHPLNPSDKVFLGFLAALDMPLSAVLDTLLIPLALAR